MLQADGHFKQALDLYVQSLKLEPFQNAALVNLGEILYWRREKKRARTEAVVVAAGAVVDTETSTLSYAKTARDLQQLALVARTSGDFSESKRVQLRLLMINIFNHPNFATPALDISSPGTVGRITSTFAGQVGEDARQIHLSLRFKF
jgi:hypothetical protein